MSSPSIGPGSDRRDRPDVFTTFLQHTMGLCQLVETLRDAPPDVLPWPQTARSGVQLPGMPPPKPRPGALDVTRLTRVLDLHLDHPGPQFVPRTLETQGWCTMADLVSATGHAGYLPAVVPPDPALFATDAASAPHAGPASFRNGLVSDCLVELEVLTGERLLRTTRADGPFADLFAAFGATRGRVGPASRLVLRMEPVPAFVAARAEQFYGWNEWAAALSEVAATGMRAGERVDLLDAQVAPRMAPQVAADGATPVASIVIGRYVTGSHARELARSHGIAAPATRLPRFDHHGRHRSRAAARRNPMSGPAPHLAPPHMAPAPHGPKGAPSDPPFALYRSADYAFRDANGPAREDGQGGPYRLTDLVAYLRDVGAGPEAGGSETRRAGAAQESRARRDGFCCDARRPSQALRLFPLPPTGDGTQLVIADRPLTDVPVSGARGEGPSADIVRRYDPNGRFVNRS